jgi:bacteriocin biosynthesis cyclodehydratase domain-containing protein
MDQGMMGQPLRSLPFLVVEIESGVVLKRGTTELRVEGHSALETVLLILTATASTPRTIDQILEQFPAIDRPQVALLLEEMSSKRLLVAADADEVSQESTEPNEDVFYWTAGKQRNDVIEALSRLNIALVGINKITQCIARSLHSMGIQHVTLVDDPALRNLEFFDESGEPLQMGPDGHHKIMTPLDFEQDVMDCGLLIATSDFGSSSFLLPWNEFCIKRGIHFMPAVLKDMIGLSGPLVIPGNTACLQCVRMRQNAHLQDAWLFRGLEEHMERGQSIAAIHPSMLTILAETTVYELCHHYGGLPELRPGRLIVINLPGGVTEHKHVLKVPRCPVCSSLLPKSPIQIRKLTPLPK